MDRTVIKGDRKKKTTEPDLDALVGDEKTDDLYAQSLVGAELEDTDDAPSQ